MTSAIVPPFCPTLSGSSPVLWGRRRPSEWCGTRRRPFSTAGRSPWKIRNRRPAAAWPPVCAHCSRAAPDLRLAGTRLGLQKSLSLIGLRASCGEKSYPPDAERGTPLGQERRRGHHLVEWAVAGLVLLGFS